MIVTVNVEVPDGAMVDHAFGIVSYFDADGRNAIAFGYPDNTQRSTIVGVMVLAMLRFIQISDGWR
jgi:hypothetical protein